MENKTPQFEDAMTVEGPAELSAQIFRRRTGLCADYICSARVDHIDPDTNTIWFAAPLPEGVNVGNLIVMKNG